MSSKSKEKSTKSSSPKASKKSHKNRKENSTPQAFDIKKAVIINDDNMDYAEGDVGDNKSNPKNKQNGLKHNFIKDDEGQIIISNFIKVSDGLENGELEVSKSSREVSKYNFFWLKLLFSSISLLLFGIIGLAINDFIVALFEKSQWAGYIGFGISLIAIISLLVIFTKEYIAIKRLEDLSKMKAAFLHVINTNDNKTAEKLTLELYRKYNGRVDIKAELANYNKAANEIIDGLDKLRYFEKNVMAKLDKQASKIIYKYAKNVGLTSAISPSALLDMVFVSISLIRMIKDIAYLYNSKVGFFSFVKLLRKIIIHLSITGGVGLSANMVNDLIGHGIMKKISTRLGEGMINSVLFARIGLFTIETIRPMPYHTEKKPKLTNIIKNIASA